MKIRNTLIILVALMMGFSTGCNKEELEQLRQDKQELNQQIEEKNATIEQLEQVNNQMQKNLQLIIDRRGIDSTVYKSLQGAQLSDRLQGLSESLETQKSEVNALRNQLRGARYQAGQYKDQVEKLEQELKMKEDTLQSIQKEMMDQAKQIDKMMAHSEKQDATIDSLQKKNKNYLEALQEKTRVVNTAYVVSGEEKSLQEKGVIKKTGGFLGIFGQTPVVDPEFNEADFSEFHIPQERELTIKAPKRKVEVVTPHPENAYTLDENGETTVLKITDTEQFWRATKHLVIVY
jgi:DNA repair exonuclease SbcCD ATPase subunit